MKKSKKKETDITRYISEFLTDYAPLHLTNSEHTLEAYEMALTLYIGYLESFCRISPQNFTIDCFDQQHVENWLNWLSTERNCSPRTCNNRLSALRKFIKFLSGKNAKYIFLATDISNVPLKKLRKTKVKGLSRDAVKALLAEPNTNYKTGIRDLAFMVILYATAARLDEVLSMRIRDLNLTSSKPHIIIVGKGEKVRTLYLLPKAVAHLKLYLKVFHGINPSSESYVFYSRNKGLEGKMSQSTIRKMMKKYAKLCHDKCEDVPLDLHAHQFRHAKASHWLEDGMNIVQISFLLGHANLETTMVYLDITKDQEMEALATLQDENDKKAIPKWNPDKDSLSSICGLRKLKS